MDKHLVYQTPPRGTCQDADVAPISVRPPTLLRRRNENEERGREIRIVKNYDRSVLKFPILPSSSSKSLSSLLPLSSSSSSSSDHTIKQRKHESLLPPSSLSLKIREGKEKEDGRDSRTESTISNSVCVDGLVKELSLSPIRRTANDNKAIKSIG